MVDFSQEIVDFDGLPMKHPTEDRPLTLRDTAVLGLIAPFEDEKTMDAGLKFKRALLAEDIHRSEGDLPLKAEDISIIKKVIGKAFAPTVILAAWRLVDPSEK
jgi:hypothetical protein